MCRDRLFWVVVLFEQGQVNSTKIAMKREIIANISNSYVSATPAVIRSESNAKDGRPVYQTSAAPHNSPPPIVRRGRQSRVGNEPTPILHRAVFVQRQERKNQVEN